MNRFLEAELKRMSEAGRLWPQEEVVIQEQVELVIGMIGHYMMWRGVGAGVWGDSNLEFVALETEFTLPIHTPGGGKSTKLELGGRFDGLVRRKDNGTFWILETKTARSIQELLDRLSIDTQAATYALAAQSIFGKQVSGVMYNVLRKKLPSRPVVLQGGDLSLNKAIDTTPAFFVNALWEHYGGADYNPEVDIDVDWAEILNRYSVLLEHLKLNGKPFFSRFPVYKTPTELANTERDLYWTGMEMTRHRTPIYPNDGWHCRYCQFKGPCMIESSGGDTQQVLEAEYRHRSEDDYLIATLEENGS